MLLLNRGGGLWGLGIPRGGDQVYAGQRQAGRSSGSLVLELDLAVTGFLSDSHLCWIYYRVEHHLKIVDNIFAVGNMMISIW